MRIVIDGSYTNIDWINFNAKSVGVKSVYAETDSKPLGEYIIYDTAGKKIDKITFKKEESINETISKKNLPIGVYIISNQTKSFKVEVK